VVSSSRKSRRLLNRVLGDKSRAAEAFLNASDAVAGANSISFIRPVASPYDQARGVSARGALHPRLAVAAMAGLVLVRTVCHISTFLPRLPSRRFCYPAFSQNLGGLRVGIMRALTPAGVAHPRQASPLALPCLLNIPPSTTQYPPNGALIVSSPSGRNRCRSQASPPLSGLAETSRRNRFVILRAARSPLATPHLASRRRSCLRLHVLRLHMAGTPIPPTMQHHGRTRGDQWSPS